MNKKLIYCAVILPLLVADSSRAEEKIDRREVRRLAKLPTEDILRDSPVERIEVADYWKKVNGRDRPMVVFFYSNSHAPSQRVATLIRYVAPHYKDRIALAVVKVADKGDPDRKTAEALRKQFSLDSTPGILFYDNVGTKTVLEDEEYIDPDFKEFRSPSMLFWSVYYSTVRKELDALLSD
ncbi:hypothetical protein NG895_02895 [Aeoliella sp. ICT_H6.2]|uniref:Thioredoxin domain-containing protein n=1 Tax=Aeoliella straminimaris TaxID=2954799 RepID=A0A9X2FB71_9BACT|nr:hypothetical protein [Aeoliella straminimaris]MCO6042846.1 hypothetical protein [Aeoliella straminimaris]